MGHHAAALDAEGARETLRFGQVETAHLILAFEPFQRVGGGDQIGRVGGAAEALAARAMTQVELVKRAADPVADLAAQTAAFVGGHRRNS